MILNTFIAVILAVIITAVNLNSEVFHIPLLIIFLSALSLGYLQPQKGWISIIQFAISIFIGFFSSKLFGFAPKNFTEFQFITYISPCPCLFGGFMGSYFSKIINQK